MAASQVSAPLVVVAALGRNRAIGRANRLPWSLPGDLARFRAITMGKPMIMGRATHEAIGRVLPGRETIVVTRRADLVAAPGLFRAGDPVSALVIARDRAAAMGAREIILAGGATLFAALLPRAARLRLTLVDLAPEADAFFPPIDPDLWREDARVDATPEAGDEASYVFVDYSRRR